MKKIYLVLLTIFCVFIAIIIIASIQNRTPSIEYNDTLAKNSAYIYLMDCFADTGKYRDIHSETLTDQKTYLHFFDFDKMVDIFYGGVSSCKMEEGATGVVYYYYTFETSNYQVELVTVVENDVIFSKIEVYGENASYWSSRKYAEYSNANYISNSQKNSGNFLIERETFKDFLNLVESGNLVNTTDKPFQGLDIAHDIYPKTGGIIKKAH